MSGASEVTSVFGDDVRHLHGNLFRVRRNRIQLSKSGLSVKDGELIYGNPRWFTNNKGELEAKGIEKSKMDELQNSIQEEGLENPIRLRVIESDSGSYLEVVNGERRFRCVESLCEKNPPCFDAEANFYRPASDVFEWIDCRVEHMDDKTALRIALKPNETSEVIGDLASFHVVKTLRQSGFDDQEILKATGKSTSWLRETEKIVDLDEKCLDHFESDRINRTVALHLSMIADLDERHRLLEEIENSSEIRHASKIKKAEQKIEKAEMNQEIHNAAAELASAEGDEEEAEIHKKKSQKAKKKVEEAKEQHENLVSGSTTATGKDVQTVEGSGPLSHTKIKSLYLDLINKVIEQNGFDDDDNSYGLDISMLTCVGGVLVAIMEGNKEAMDVLSEFCPLVMDESDEDSSEEDEEESEIEASDDDEDNHEEDDDDYDDDDNDDDDEDDEIEDSHDEEDDYEEIDPDLEREFSEAAAIDEEDYE
jgi:hypothetical protein